MSTVWQRLRAARERRLVRWTAVNLDGRRRYVTDRSSDSWALDPQLPDFAQVGESLYADNDLDRGHLVWPISARSRRRRWPGGSRGAG